MKTKNDSKPIAYVIEDDHSLSRAFAIALEMADYKPLQIHNKVEFDSVFGVDGNMTGNDVPVLVFLDLALPDTDGEILLGIMREDRRYDDTKVVVITANNQRVDDINTSADMVILKPVTLEVLIEVANRFRPK